MALFPVVTAVSRHFHRLSSTENGPMILESVRTRSLYCVRWSSRDGNDAMSVMLPDFHSSGEKRPNTRTPESHLLLLKFSRHRVMTCRGLILCLSRAVNLGRLSSQLVPDAMQSMNV